MRKKKRVVKQFIDIISSIFTPILGVLAATGMIKGFNALFLALGWLSIIRNLSNIKRGWGFFILFLPNLPGIYSSKKFGKIFLSVWQ